MRPVAASVLVFLLAGTAVADQQPPASAPAVAKSHLAGRVIDDGTSRPLIGARVTLYVTPGPKPVRDTLTDIDGAFSFPSLPPGVYEIVAFAPGWLRTTLGQKQPERAGTRLVVAEGQSMRDLTLRVFRGAVISGQVFGHAGQPLIGTVVTAYRLRFELGGPSLVTTGEATTDDRGQFRVFGLPPGEYFVQASPSSGSRMHIAAPALDLQPTRTNGYVATFYPASATPSQAAPVVVKAGEERMAIDFSLPLVPFVSVRGVIRGMTGPISKAYFSTVVDEGLMRYGNSLEAMTSPDGMFVIRNVPAGPLTFLVGAIGPPSVASVAGVPPDTAWALTRLVVPDRDVSDLTISVHRGATLSGVFKFSEGVPPINLSTTRVSIAAVHAGLTASGSAESVSGLVGADGRFAIRGLPPSWYYLALNLPAQWSIASVVADGGDRTLSAMEVGTGDISDVEITLINRPTSLSGTVSGPSNVSVAGYTAILFPAEPSVRESRTRAVYTATVDTGAQFVMARVLPGRYLLGVVDDIDPNAWFDPRLLAQIAVRATPVIVTAGQANIQNFRVATRE